MMTLDMMMGRRANKHMIKFIIEDKSAIFLSIIIKPALVIVGAWVRPGSGFIVGGFRPGAL